MYTIRKIGGKAAWDIISDMIVIDTQRRILDLKPALSYEEQEELIDYAADLRDYPSACSVRRSVKRIFKYAIAKPILCVIKFYYQIRIIRSAKKAK